jgi:histidyl-tRNA synthetase
MSEPQPNKPKKEGGKITLQAPKGMHDILPEEQVWYDRVYRVARDLADFYSFGKIDTPILENAGVFERGVGGETDLVEKEMYVVKTKGGDTLALRPENTAGVMRAYLEHHLGRGAQPKKFFYQGQFFRHENPQAGRFRQFHQLGYEIIGGQNDPIYDAQVILVFQRLLEELKLKNIVLKINSIGCRVCRPGYKRALQNYYKPFEKKICADCARRVKTNPLRLLDCKKEQCQEFKAKAPNFLDKLCTTCSQHLKSVLEYLEELGIQYQLDNQLVRGLDYYSRTVFEFFIDGTDVGAVGGGGRYDYLAELLGGRLTPAVGAAPGVERIIAAMKAQEVKLPLRNTKRVFLIHVGELAKKKSLRVVEDLRRAGIGVSEALGRDSLKAQMKTADKEGYELALIFGQREIFEESIIIRNLRNSLQESVSLSKLVEEIKHRLKA